MEENYTVLTENGINCGELGVPQSETTLLGDPVAAETGLIEDVTCIRKLAWRQYRAAEDVRGQLRKLRESLLDFDQEKL